MDKDLEQPQDGILVHGLFMDGFRWDDAAGTVGEAIPGCMVTRLPMMLMQPCMDYEADAADYASPLYKTALRAGTLSTTG